MDQYLDTACEIEILLDNALNRCFHFGDSARHIKRTLDHAFYLQSEFAQLRNTLRRCGTLSQDIDYTVYEAWQAFQDYCNVLEEISAHRSPEIMVNRRRSDISIFRSRLDASHAELTSAIDEHEARPGRRLSPLSLTRMPQLESPGLYERPSPPAIILNSSLRPRARPRRVMHMSNLAGPSRFVPIEPMAEPGYFGYRYEAEPPIREYVVRERVQTHGFAPRPAIYEADWIEEDVRPSGYRHVRGPAW